MSNYIAVDLDALKRVPLVAAAARLRPESVTHGLVSLWQWCWGEKVEHVTLVHLAGFFKGRPRRTADALEAFRFLEASAKPGEWRVRGVDRYLRIQEARSRGGKAASGNLKRGKTKPAPVSPAAPAPAGSQPEVSREQAGTESPAPPGSFTEHRTPNTLETKEEGAAGAVAPPRRISNWAGFVPTAPPAASREPAEAPQPEPTQLNLPEEPQKPKGLPPRSVDRENPHDMHWLRMQEVREAEGYARDIHPPPRHEVAKYCNGVMLALQGDEERALESYAAWLREPGVRQRCGPWKMWLSQWETKLLPATPRRTSAQSQLPPCSRCGEASIGQTWGVDVCAGCNAEWSASDGEGEAGFRAWLGRRPALRAVGGGA